jgi:hypothetical protein
MEKKERLKKKINGCVGNRVIKARKEITIVE